MKRIALSLAALAILMTVGLGAEELFPSKLVPADAHWALQLNVSVIKNSRINALLEKGEAFRDLERARKVILALYEVDISKNIERITLIGLRPNAEPVVCFEGQIPREHLLGLLSQEESHRETPFGKIVIHSWGTHENGAFVGDRLAFISEDADALKRVLAVVAGEKPDFKAEGLLPRVAVQPGGGLLTGFIRDLSSMMRHERGPAILTKVKAAVIQATEKAENVLLNLRIESTSAADAEQIRQVVQGLIALAGMEREGAGSRFDLRNLSVSVEGNWVNLLLTSPLKTFVEFLQGQTRLRNLGSFGEVFLH